MGKGWLFLNKYENLLWQYAWGCYRRLSNNGCTLQVEELFHELLIVFSRCVDRYWNNRKKKEFLKLLCRSCRNRCADIVVEESRRQFLFQSQCDCQKVRNVGVESTLLDEMEQLVVTPVAKRVIRLIKDNSDELFKIAEERKKRRVRKRQVTKSDLANLLRKEGFRWIEIWDGCKEIKEKMRALRR